MPTAQQKPFDYLSEFAPQEPTTAQESDSPKPTTLRQATRQFKREQQSDPYAEAAQEWDKQQAREFAQLFQAGEDFVVSPSSQKSGSGNYEPQILNARHREIIRLHVLGYKHVEVAAMLGIAPQTVYYTVSSPMGRGLIAEISEARTDSVKDVRIRLKQMSPFAAEVLLDILSSGTQTNQLKAAAKVLEMTGHKPGEVHNHRHTHLSVSEIQELKQQVRAGEIQAPLVLEEANEPEPAETPTSISVSQPEDS